MSDCRNKYSRDLMESIHEEYQEKRINKGSMKRTKNTLKTSGSKHTKNSKIEYLLDGEMVVIRV